MDGLMAKPCTREGCDIAQSGVCLEGFSSSEDCPHVADPAVSAESEAEDGIWLRGGEALELEEAANICRKGQTKVVLLAGPRESGKTTIITSLYESFQDAPFGGYSFAGSETLVGFERRCH